MAGEDWTDRDLAALSDFDLRGMSPAAIAERMDRSLADVEDHLTIVRQRNGRPGSPQDAVADEDKLGGP